MNWRINIRIKCWMYAWNRRFAHRYDDRNGWKEYYESLVYPYEAQAPTPPRFP